MYTLLHGNRILEIYVYVYRQEEYLAVNQKNFLMMKYFEFDKYSSLVHFDSFSDYISPWQLGLKFLNPNLKCFKK